MTNNRKNYRLDVDKIKTLKDVKNVLDNLHLLGYYDADDPNDENYYLSEYFTIPQERQGLTFSTPRKSLEQIQKEYDEKFEELLVKTKRKFAVSQEHSEYRFKQFCDNQDYLFRTAIKDGEFPQKINWVMGTGLGVNAVSYGQSIAIKQGGKHEGYYTFGNRRYFKYYLPDKPNFLNRFFMKVCLGFWWVDEKND